MYSTDARRVLVLACGALASEIVALRAAKAWDALTLKCLPAKLHNRPEQIAPRLRDALQQAAADGFRRVFIAYADCGTGGAIDRLIDEYRSPTNASVGAGEGGLQVERLPGAHCYAFYAGLAAFEELADAEPGTFYLTDFLTKHFQRLVWQGLGLDRHPELEALYFGNYRRLVYLAQTEQPALQRHAAEIAERLGLSYCYRYCGYGELAVGLQRSATAAV